MTQGTPAAQMIDAAWVEEFVGRWSGALNAHEASGVLALMAADIVYDDSAWPTQIRGHDEVRPFLDHIWTGMPDLRFEMTDGPYVMPGQPKAAFAWRGTATHAGLIDPPGLRATGRAIEFEGLATHEYRDGKVARLRVVFDRTDVMRQLGVLPPAGSREERVMAKVTNLRGRLPLG